MVRRQEGRIELLLQKRSRTKESFPGCYDTSCAGHLSAGDTFLEAALRGSFEEELGLRASGEELYFAGIYPCQVDDYFGGKHILDREISAVYLYEEAGKRGSGLKASGGRGGVGLLDDFERLKELAAAGAEGYSFFRGETSALESAFHKGVTEYDERIRGYHIKVRRDARAISE